MTDPSGSSQLPRLPQMTKPNARGAQDFPSLPPTGLGAADPFADLQKSGLPGLDSVARPGAKPGADGTKGPLDVLEDILNNAGESAKEKEEQLAADREAAAEQKKKDDLEKLRQEQHIEDQRQIEEQLQTMQQLKQSPEELERQRQEEEKKKTHEEQTSAADGYDVRQLGHDKI